MLLGLRHRLKVLHFDTSAFEPNPNLEAERCCLCNQFSRPRVAVKTQGRWGVWRDRYLCTDCTTIAAHVNQALARAAVASLTPPAPPQKPATPKAAAPQVDSVGTVEQKHREIEIAVLEALYTEERSMGTNQIYQWLERRNRFFTRRYVNSACQRLRDRGILQVELGPHNSYLWAIATQQSEEAA